MKKLILNFALLKDTKSCYRFEHKNADGTFMTLYVKKDDISAAGIDPQKGVTVTIEEGTTNA